MAKGIWQKYNVVNGTRKELAEGGLRDVLPSKWSSYYKYTNIDMYASGGAYGSITLKFAGNQIYIESNKLSIKFGASIESMIQGIKSGQHYYYFDLAINAYDEFKGWSAGGENGISKGKDYILKAYVTDVAESTADKGYWYAGIEQSYSRIVYVKDVPTKNKGTYIANVTANVGTYPANGIHSDG